MENAVILPVFVVYRCSRRTSRVFLSIMCNPSIWRDYSPFAGQDIPPIGCAQLHLSCSFRSHTQTMAPLILPPSVFSGAVKQGKDSGFLVYWLENEVKKRKWGSTLQRWARFVTDHWLWETSVNKPAVLKLGGALHQLLGISRSNWTNKLITALTQLKVGLWSARICGCSVFRVLA